MSGNAFVGSVVMVLTLLFVLMSIGPLVSAFLIASTGGGLWATLARYRGFPA